MKKIGVLLFFIVGTIGISAQEAKHVVGERFGGGVIFYVEPNCEHGLIVEESEFKVSILVAGMFFQKYGDIQLKSDEAKKYFDWRLPTYLELKLLYNNKSNIDIKFNGLYATEVFAYFCATTEPNMGVLAASGIDFKNGSGAGPFAMEMIIKQIRSF